MVEIVWRFYSTKHTINIPFKHEQKAAHVANVISPYSMCMSNNLLCVSSQ